MQDRAFINSHCAGFPGAEVSQPFGPEHDCWKVGGKIFAIIGQAGDGVSLKTDHADTARLRSETGRGRLLAVVEMKCRWDLPLHVEGVTPLLEAADGEHLAVELELK